MEFCFCGWRMLSKCGIYVGQDPPRAARRTINSPFPFPTGWLDCWVSTSPNGVHCRACFYPHPIPHVSQSERPCLFSGLFCFALLYSPPTWCITFFGSYVLSSSCRLPRCLRPQEVESSTAQAYADEIGAMFVETSAKDDTHVQDMFVELSKRLPKREPLPTPSGVDLSVDSPSSASSCC